MHPCRIAFLTVGATIGLLGPVPAQPDPPLPQLRPFTPRSPDEAWSRLPPPKRAPLPAWARVMAEPLPKTTAKLLELNYLHRAENPLGPVLAAKVRLVVADTLKSEAGVQEAAVDLLREGLSLQDLPVRMLVAPPSVSEAERTLLAFARKLTEAGSTITDQEFARVLQLLGPAKTTALVHTVAYANFQNRLVLGLGVKDEIALIGPPVATRFDLEAVKVPAPERPPWDDLKSVRSGGLSVRVDWDRAGWEEVNAAQEKQKDRTLRIPLPDQSAYEGLTQREKDQAQKILWNTVSMGYQPQMTRAWFAALYAFYDEAKPNRVFTNSMFWVVTRTNDCFY